MIVLKIILSDTPVVCGEFRLRLSAWKDVGSDSITNRGSPTCWIVMAQFSQCVTCSQKKREKLGLNKDDNRTKSSPDSERNNKNLLNCLKNVTCPVQKKREKSQSYQRKILKQ